MKNTSQNWSDFPVLCIMPLISWTVESRGIYLINTSSGNSKFLPYPQAAFWDLFVRGYSYPQILVLLSAIVSVDNDKTVVLIRETLNDLVENGFLKQK